MIDPKEFVASLRENGIEFFSGVPDSLLKELCSCIAQESPGHQHIVAANEGGAVALAMGYHLATGNLPLVYLQNSGLGNIINPVLSLADKEVYSIPMLLVIGWRGEPGVHDEPQHKKQGRVMLAMLDAMEIPFSLLSPRVDQADAILKDAIGHARKTSAPYALVVQKDTFKPFAAFQSENASFPLSREEAIHQVIEGLDDRDIIVSTTGMPSREVYDYRRKKGDGHHRDFLTVGGMGHASHIALGIALQRPDCSVYCLDGDGATLMHMGSLSLNGTLKQKNFKHIILNNGVHDSVGGQPTVGLAIDFLGIARASGYGLALRAQTREELESSLTDLKRSSGPSLLEVRVHRGARKDLGRPTTTPIQNKQVFMDFLGSHR